MKKLSKEEMKHLEKIGNKIEIKDEYHRIKFNFYFIYQGDAQEAIFLDNKFLMYIDLDEEIEKIETREDEKEAIKKQIETFMEEPDFMYEIISMEGKYEY
jgi:hypothetical protein